MEEESFGLRARIYSGVFLISLAILLLELILTRIFSVTMYYHFAFMAISLALFGSGASGVFVYLKSERFTAERATRHMAISSLLMAVSIVLALAALLNVSAGLHASWQTYLTLAGLYIVCALPFFFGGLALTLAIRKLAAQSSRLYFFDLAGASFGCLLVIPALNRLGGPTAMLAIGFVASAAALAFVWRDGSRHLMRLALVVLAVFAALVAVNGRYALFDIRYAKGQPQQAAIFSKWNSYSRVTVSGDLNDIKPLWITIDGDAGSPILHYSNNPDAMEYVERKVSALAYQIKPGAKTLIIGPGGGREVVTALQAGSRDVTGVEVNDLIVRDVMLNEPFKSFSGNLYARPEVKAVVDEGRSYIRGSGERFDIIQASLIDTWAASSAGAFALTENNLYTVEAFGEYMDHLTGDGILTMTRWLLNPPQQELRLMSLARELMARRGVARPERHLAVFKALGQDERVESCFLFKKSEFTDEEIRALEAYAASIGCEVLYTPLTRPPNYFTELATTANPEAFYRRYPINVRPTYDDSPFFFYHVEPSDLLEAFQLTSESQKTNLGVFVLFSLLGITALFVCGFIIGPLFLARRRVVRESPSSTLARLAYFGLLGFGFIVVEMAMIQRFILFLGHPVYALAVVLFSILLWSAVGSLLTSRFADRRLERVAPWVLGLVAMLTIVYVYALPPLFADFGGYGLRWRLLLAVVFLIPLAMLMGMPMPLGLRMLNRRRPQLVPWAWGINGAMSVMGSVSAIILAMNLGFSQTLMIGASAYICSMLLIILKRDREGSSLAASDECLEDPGEPALVSAGG